MRIEVLQLVSCTTLIVYWHDFKPIKAFTIVLSTTIRREGAHWNRIKTLFKIVVLLFRCEIFFFRVIFAASLDIA
jgi:hypothetical protein